MNERTKRQIKRFFRTFFRRKVVIFGTIIITLLVLMAIFADVLSPYAPNKQNLRETLQDPSAAHLLGTDQLGRDILTRIFHGSRISLLVGISTILLAGSVGMIIGMVSGYVGKGLDSVIMRFMDAQMSIPPMVLSMALCSAMGGGLVPMIVSMSFAYMPTYVRIMRSQVLAIKEADYITASNIIGNPPVKTMLRHLFPNCLSPLIIQLTLNLGQAILTESSLSFLGMGVVPPTATWGSMVSQGYKYLFDKPMMCFIPGFCIMLVVLGFNMVGDGLRDALDPRLRGVI
ncbi:MAG: ABC transporter permease [Clostridia bacterium]|nr:ABC transporter permease [Clostridia bacterium]